MAKKKFKIRARLVFSGEFTVRAASRQDAEEAIRKNCGCLRAEVQCADEDIEWEFPVHGDIVINRREED